MQNVSCRTFINVYFFVQVSEVEPRSALIQLTPPECTHAEYEIEPAEFGYELLLSDKGREGKYKPVYR